jgi:energy-coupling factor transporter ATP-binding protein EcfA2|tara:strand:+ start:5751 stop:7490 length:1740 start_codon:yes stop_codon:yes gene_type:complete
MLEEQLNECLKMPIDFCSESYKTPSNLFGDLELLETSKDVSNCSLYDHLLKPQTPFGYVSMEKWSEKYTTNIDFLKDTQKMLENNPKIDDSKLKTVQSAWSSYKNMKENKSFKDKFQFVNWAPVEFLNSSVAFLTLLSMYSIMSPLLNLLAPLLLLIIPFIVMKIKGATVSIGNYMVLLSVSLKKHSFGRLLTDWKSLPWSQRSYMGLMLGMYVYNIYQNAISCYQFYNNTTTINDDIKNIKEYIIYTREKISEHIIKIDNLKTYKPYQKYLQTKLENLNDIYTSLNSVPLVGFNPKKIPYIGYTMKQYYMLYNSEEVRQAMLFSFGFHGYLDNIGEISTKIKGGSINKCKFVKKENAVVKFRGASYPVMQNQKGDKKNIPNNVDLKLNKLITGPNASGKTSLLKNTISNILLSQQFGYGYYKKGKITPFNYIHCYLNIPDTSSRDSLFQAEARRCLDILNCIDKHKDKKHFCIFDELFSGTNPYEAISSADAYLSYISKYPGVKFMLTTHFIQLCKKLQTNKNISNVNMRTELFNDNPKYYYKMQKGISEIKGGITVLKQLGYPAPIIERTTKSLNKL